LEMAGSCADGVFIRVGTDIGNIATSVERIRLGASKSNRDPNAVKIGAVFHTVFYEDEESSLLMAKSMAAGYYEYSPMLLNNIGLGWEGPHPEQLKKQGKVWPDFHHAPDLIESGRAVGFLSERHADAFCLRGDAHQIANQIVRILEECKELDIEFEYVVLQPIPNPPTPDLGKESYIEQVPEHILSSVKNSLTK